MLGQTGEHQGVDGLVGDARPDPRVRRRAQGTFEHPGRRPVSEARQGVTQRAQRAVLLAGRQLFKRPPQVADRGLRRPAGERRFRGVQQHASRPPGTDGTGRQQLPGDQLRVCSLAPQQRGGAGMRGGAYRHRHRVPHRGAHERMRKSQPLAIHQMPGAHQDRRGLGGLDRRQLGELARVRQFATVPQHGDRMRQPDRRIPKTNQPTMNTVLHTDQVLNRPVHNGTGRKSRRRAAPPGARR